MVMPFAACLLHPPPLSTIWLIRGRPYVYKRLSPHTLPRYRRTGKLLTGLACGPQLRQPLEAGYKLIMGIPGRYAPIFHEYTSAPVSAYAFPGLFHRIQKDHWSP